MLSRWGFLGIVSLVAPSLYAQYSLDVYTEDSSGYETNSEVRQTISPQNLDSTILLKSDTSLDTNRSGTQSQENAIRFRGSSLENTEIFIDEMTLVHPYTSYPLNEDLDVRAFDSLTTTTNRDEWNLASSLSSSGSVHFGIAPVSNNDFTLGIDTGSLVGQSIWVRHRFAHAKNSLSLQTFAKTSASHGSYTYYDSNGTPSNSADDRYSRRQDNQSQSFQIFPILHYKIGSWTLQNFLFINRKSFGIPSRTTTDPTEITKNRFTDLAYIRAERYFPHPSLIRKLSFHLSHLQQDSKMRDPHYSLLKLSRHREESVNSTQSSIALSGVQNELSWRLRIDYTNGKYRQDEDQQQIHLERAHLKTSAQATLKISPTWGLRVSSDSLFINSKDQDEPRSLKRTHHFNYQFGVQNKKMLGPVRTLSSLYYKESERPPSLLELFGDSAYLQQNSSLNPEVIHHVGFRTQISYQPSPTQSLALSLSGFQERGRNLIFFVPSSFPGSFVARNLDEVEKKGLETSLGLKSGNFKLDLQSFLRTAQNIVSNKTLPQQPPLTMSVHPSWSVRKNSQQITTGLLSKYESSFFRDENNRFPMPAFLTHDIYMRLNFRPAPYSLIKEMSWVIYVDNLMDLTYATVADRIEPYAKIEGYAKAGRSIWGSMWLRF